jgi:hypothetical protein
MQEPKARWAEPREGQEEGVAVGVIKVRWTGGGRLLLAVAQAGQKDAAQLHILRTHFGNTN